MANADELKQMLNSFAGAVRGMRIVQKAYFRTRDKEALIASKECERLVDLAITRLEEEGLCEKR
jgi:hypothetical protein